MSRTSRTGCPPHTYACTQLSAANCTPLLVHGLRSSSLHSPRPQHTYACGPLPGHTSAAAGLWAVPAAAAAAPCCVGNWQAGAAAAGCRHRCSRQPADCTAGCGVGLAVTADGRAPVVAAAAVTASCWLPAPAAAAAASPAAPAAAAAAGAGAAVGVVGCLVLHSKDDKQLVKPGPTHNTPGKACNIHTHVPPPVSWRPTACPCAARVCMRHDPPGANVRDPDSCHSCEPSSSADPSALLPVPLLEANS